MGKGFHQTAIFPESETAIAGSVNQSRLAGVALAALEDNVVNE